MKGFTHLRSSYIIALIQELTEVEIRHVHKFTKAVLKKQKLERGIVK